MALHIVKLAVFKHRRGHVGILDAVIGDDRGREIFPQIHFRKTFGVLLRDLIAAGPELFLLLVR